MVIKEKYLLKIENPSSKLIEGTGIDNMLSISVIVDNIYCYHLSVIIYLVLGIWFYKRNTEQNMILPTFFRV